LRSSPARVKRAVARNPGTGVYFMTAFMNHRMRLYSAGFYGIKEGKQVIEVRLLDEKRRLLNLGDVITFSLLPDLNERVQTQVVGLLRYSSFQELFTDISLSDWNAQGWTVERAVDRCREIYSMADEERYGVLGIRLRVI